MGTRVPVRQEQHALRSRGSEAREEIAQMERVALAGDVGDRLHGNGVRAGPQLGEDPVPGALVRRGVRDARPELHLLLQVRERVAAVELAGPAGVAARLAGEQEQEKQGLEVVKDGGGGCRHAHWIRPTLVCSSTNAMITSCEVLRLACRSSFTRYAIWKPALRVGGKSVSRESCICVWRLSTYGTHVVWPASCRQTVFTACEYRADVRTSFLSFRIAAGGLKAKPRLPLCWSRSVWNTLPELRRSLVLLEASNDVEMPCRHVSASSGRTVRSVVSVTAPPPTSLKPSCSATVRAARYASCAFTAARTRPRLLRGGAKLQLNVPDGHSRLLVRIGTCRSVRSAQVTPSVSR